VRKIKQYIQQTEGAKYLYEKDDICTGNGRNGPKVVTRRSPASSREKLSLLLATKLLFKGFFICQNLHCFLVFRRV